MKNQSWYLCLILVMGLFLSGASPANWHDVDRYRFFLGNSIQSELETLIDRADDSVTVGMYYVMPPQTAGVTGILEALVEAEKRGVEVNVGVELKQESKEWNRSVKTYLNKRSVDARFWYDDQIQHQKVIIVDEELVFVGSQNLSYSALMGKNWETGVIAHAPAIAKRVKQYVIEQR